MRDIQTMLFVIKLLFHIPDLQKILRKFKTIDSTWLTFVREFKFEWHVYLSYCEKKGLLAISKFILGCSTRICFKISNKYCKTRVSEILSNLLPLHS